jgi:acetyl esterase/lipase
MFTTQRVKIGTGKRQVRLLVLIPRTRKPGKVPGVLWIHGGGYQSGSAKEVFLTRALSMVVRFGMVLVAPDYRLSRHHPYPAGLHDCYAALLWLKEHAEELNVRSDQIMIGGESAGGGMTAALCMLARDRGDVRIAFQMPLYPMLDCYDTPSSRDNHAKGWDTRQNHLAWKLYLRGLNRDEPVPCYASPSRREDYSGLPPCYTFVGDLEPFLDETLTYVENLKKAGVEAEADVWPGFWHAYDVMHAEKPESKQAAEKFLRRFREACEKYFAPQS